MRKEFETLESTEEKHAVISLLSTAFMAHVINRQVAEATRIKLLRSFMRDDDLSPRTHAASAVYPNGWAPCSARI